jgi:hypothetical protein
MHSVATLEHYEYEDSENAHGRWKKHDLYTEGNYMAYFCGYFS